MRKISVGAKIETSSAFLEGAPDSNLAMERSNPPCSVRGQISNPHLARRCLPMMSDTAW